MRREPGVGELDADLGERDRLLADRLDPGLGDQRHRRVDGHDPDAIDALATRQIDVESMISKMLPLSRAVEAFALAAESKIIKVLLKPGG